MGNIFYCITHDKEIISETKSIARKTAVLEHKQIGSYEV